MRTISRRRSACLIPMRISQDADAAPGNLLKCFAVDESLRGQNALGSLVSRLVENRFEAGHYDLFVITRPKNKVLFTSCGFYPLAETESVLMLENKKSGLDNYYKKFLAGTDTDENVGMYRHELQSLHERSSRPDHLRR